MLAVEPVSDAGQHPSDEESAVRHEQLKQAKRAVTPIDPQWAELFDRAEDSIERSRWLQRKLGDVLALAARILRRRR